MFVTLKKLYLYYQKGPHLSSFHIVHTKLSLHQINPSATAGLKFELYSYSMFSSSDCLKKVVWYWTFISWLWFHILFIAIRQLLYSRVGVGIHRHCIESIQGNRVHWMWTSAGGCLNLGLICTSRLRSLTMYISTSHKLLYTEYWNSRSATSPRCISDLDLDRFVLVL